MPDGSYYGTPTNTVPSTKKLKDGSKKNKIIETQVCNTQAACEAINLLNTSVSHSPVQTTIKCEPGKFMYYGWEDQPSGDEDYNGLRVVIGCPFPATPGSAGNVVLVE